MSIKNYTRAFFLFVILGISSSMPTIQAQETDWRVLVEQMAEEEEPRAGAIENLYEELLYLENNPMDLNSVSRDQLERFPLLSLEEANNLVDFLEKNRPLYTVYELRNVPRLDHRTVALILPFFRIGETVGVQIQTEARPVDILKRGQHEAQVRFDKTLTPRAGYGEFSDSILERYPNRKYRGEDFYTSLRYSFRYRDKVQMGFTAEKDAGEPFLKTGYPKGYDHYGVHLIVRDIGRLKTVVLGDYRLSFGQGLVLNNDFVGSKAWSTDNVSRRTQVPKRHFSTAESGFFRGAAAVAEFGDISLT
ncbi:MAG: helix-hairpin-helix domain-containing protein, partial [Proteiniphilum sp.]